VSQKIEEIKQQVEFRQCSNTAYLSEQEGQHPLTGQRAPPISSGT